jgi:hypothetical protein
LNLVELQTPLEADIVFSLGLLDWISPTEIKRLNVTCKNIPNYLHSFTRRKFSLQLIAHKAFVLISYGLYNKLYMPNYYSFENLKSYFNNENLTIDENHKLGIGAIIKNWQ